MSDMSNLRRELHAFAERIADAIEAQSTGSEWVDQDASPLGRDRHMRLARKGTLKATKDGRKVLVRRADIEAYLAKKTVIQVDEKADNAAEVARVRALLEKKTRAA